MDQNRVLVILGVAVAILAGVLLISNVVRGSVGTSKNVEVSSSFSLPVSSVSSKADSNIDGGEGLSSSIPNFSDAGNSFSLPFEIGASSSSVFFQNSIAKDIFTERDDVTVKAGEVVNSNIVTKSGNIYIGDRARVNGSIISESGFVTVGNNVRINNNISLMKGDLIIGSNNTLSGTVYLGSGVLSVGEKNNFNADVYVKKDRFRELGANNFNGFSPLAN